MRRRLAAPDDPLGVFTRFGLGCRARGTSEENAVRRCSRPTATLAAGGARLNHRGATPLYPTGAGMCHH